MQLASSREEEDDASCLKEAPAPGKSCPGKLLPGSLKELIVPIRLLFKDGYELLLEADDAGLALQHHQVFLPRLLLLAMELASLFDELHGLV